ncbi:MAG: MFS transporter [Gammaproteobacteria bacterium]|nr:MFS transporter [Gammaproteobacteria bacterium]
MMILFAVILMDLLTGMEFDLFVPSFPELQAQFNLTPFWVEALLSANFIGYCISLFFVGSLADRYGRKPIILLGLLIFVIGSILCVSAPTYSCLLIGRFLQGIGIAAPAILSFLIIADSYAMKKQQFLLAMLNGSMNIAVAVSPLIGSYIALYFQWRGNFVLLLILGLIVLLASVFFVPKYKLPEHKETISLRGYLPLFKSKPLMLLMANIILMIIPYWIFVGMSPLLYMKNLGVSLRHFGYYQGIFALVFALGSILFGLMMHRYTQKKILHVSGLVYLFSLITLVIATFWGNHNPLLITLAFLPFIISQIMPSTQLYPLCLNFMPQAKAKVSAMIQGGRLVFTALSLQIASCFYEGSFRNIGIIISVVIFMAIVTHFFVLRNRELMTFAISDQT